MLGVFGVMTAQESPEPLARIAMYIFDPGFILFESQYSHRVFQSLSGKTGGLAVKILDKVCMVLSEQGRNGVILG